MVIALIFSNLIMKRFVDLIKFKLLASLERERYILIGMKIEF